MTDRRAEVRARLDGVRDRIARSMAGAGRADEVTLVAVTKRYPASDIALLVSMGVRDIGENTEQELRAKLEDPVLAGRRPRVHFIGQLQSNKAASVARLADAVHSVDRHKLVRALAAHREGEPLDVLVQVCLDDQPGRGGVDPAGLADLCDAVAGEEALRLRGLMAVAPLGGDPDAAFDRLAGLHAEVRARHTEATWLSAGMSGDLEAAVRHGATHLRVGSAILGTRSSLG